MTHTKLEKRIKLFGIYIDNLTIDETIKKIEQFIQEETPHQHVVVNSDKILKTQKDNNLRKIINNCDLINSDGMAVVWSSKILGKPLKERVAGIDLFFKLIEKATYKEWKVYLLGAEEEVIEKVVRKFRNNYPQLKIVGYRNGYWNNDKEVVFIIKEAKPDILFVGINSPKKEVFLSRYLKEMNVPFVMGVGGTFDIIAGKTNRAPLWMQKIGFEWFFRLAQEPKRLWRRYLIGNTIFIWLVLKEFLKIKLLGKKNA